MIGILERVFIKNGNAKSSKTAQAYAMLCSTASIALNLLLSVGKLLAGTLSGSVAITADAFNNLADAGTCAAELLGFKIAGYGAGETHPFGHGRIEWLMGLIASILVLFTGGEMAKTAIAAIRSPQPLEFHIGTVVVLAVSIAVKLYMYYYNKRIGAKIGSVAMKAKAYDCLGDTAATSVVLLSVLAGHFLGWQIDGWCGVAVAVFILYAGLQALKETAGPMMGGVPDYHLTDTIAHMCGEYTQITGIYELMVHDYGFHRRMVSFHIAGDSDNDGKLVRIASELSSRLRLEAGCEATIQVEPLVCDAQMTDCLLDRIQSSVQQIDQENAVKHLRLVQHLNHTTICLDVIIPPELTKRESDIRAAVASSVQTIDHQLELDMKVRMSASSKHHQLKKQMKGYDCNENKRDQASTHAG